MCVYAADSNSSTKLQRKACLLSGESNANSQNLAKHTRVHYWSNAIVPLVIILAAMFVALITDWKNDIKKNFDSDHHIRSMDVLTMKENYMKGIILMYVNIAAYIKLLIIIECPEMTPNDIFELSAVIASYGNWKEWCEYLKLDEVICNSIDQSREHDTSKPLTLTKAYLNQVNTCWKQVIEVLCMKLHKPRSARDLALKHGIMFSIVCI